MSEFEVERTELPSLDHITREVTRLVYPPDEDTYFLMDVLVSDVVELSRRKGELLLEVGPGSGAVLAAVALKFPYLECVGCDANLHACRATAQTFAANSVQNASVVHGDMFAPFGRASFDIVAFNPPYVPTDSVPDPRAVLSEFEQFDLALAGGPRGRVLIDRFLCGLAHVLRPRGVAYMLCIRANDPASILALCHTLGFRAEIVATRASPSEEMCVLKITQNKEDA